MSTDNTNRKPRSVFDHLRCAGEDSLAIQECSATFAGYFALAT